MHACVGQVAELGVGDHACLVYGEGDDPAAAVADYVQRGLDAGERCLFVVGELDPEHVRAALVAGGIDVRAHEARGALVLVTRWDVSFPDGAFDPAAMIDYVRQGVEAALAQGFAAVRLVAEMTWALALEVGQEALLEYEILGNALKEEVPLSAVCMYDRSRFPGEVCRDALRVHPTVAVGTETFDNLFYEPPEAVLGEHTANQRVNWMLGQLRRVREAEAQRIELAQARADRDAKDRLIATLAHELRTPLSAVLGQARFLSRLLDEGDVDAALLRQSLRVVRRQAGLQARLVEHVLAAAALGRGTLSVDPIVVDLAELVGEVLSDLALHLEGRVVDLEIPSRPRVRADPHRLEQVLVNLLDNAAKFSPPGTAIEIRVDRQASFGLVSVRDHGPGVPAEHRDQIFERYHQVGHGHGLGLGLHLAREILLRHDGGLELELPEDGGARFVARLPVA